MEARGHEPFSVRLVSVTPDAEHQMAYCARSWIHYLQSRCADGVQLEHKEVALAIRNTIFKEQFPTLYEAIFEQNNKAEKLN